MKPRRRPRLGEPPGRAGCVLMTAQQRGYSGVAEPKLQFYSYRRAGSEWERESRAGVAAALKMGRERKGK